MFLKISQTSQESTCVGAFFYEVAGLQATSFLKSDSSASVRQGNYWNNLATRVIPFFIISKSSVGEAISKTVLPHFLMTSLSRYRWRHNLRSAQNLLFQTCLNYIVLGCSLCTNQLLIKHYGFKMQGKQDIFSDSKCYDVITGK